MTPLKTVEEAIRERIPISFEYIRPGKQSGERYGHPHAVYIYRLKNGTENVYLDLWQVSGVTDTADDRPLPSWRQFFFNDVQDVTLDRSASPFEIAEGYNPSSDKYMFTIARV